jgi:ribosomal protein S18 acetylase RimI-like enzyme
VDDPSFVRPLADAAEAAECARLMASSEPWLTLGRGYEECLAVVSDPAKEVYVLPDAAGLAGFVVVDMRGVLRGYIQSICVASDRRGRGVGTELLGWAEDRIRRDSPNVFLCVSSFNTAAQRFYVRLGYELVGTLPDFVVAGHDELLLRKSAGPWASFRRPVS